MKERKEGGFTLATPDQKKDSTLRFMLRIKRDRTHFSISNGLRSKNSFRGSGLETFSVRRLIPWH